MFLYKFQTGLTNYYLKHLTPLTMSHQSSFWGQLKATTPSKWSFFSSFAHLKYLYYRLPPSGRALGILTLSILLRSSRNEANFNHPCRYNLCLVAETLICPFGRKDHPCVHSNRRTFSYIGNSPFWI